MQALHTIEVDSCAENMLQSLTVRYCNISHEECLIERSMGSALTLVKQLQ